MKPRKWPLVAALSFATLFIIACGDDKDPRISDADALCLKILRNGGTCGPNGAAGGGSTAPSQTTVTVTHTQTQTNN
jgi:hypothetical protein